MTDRSVNGRLQSIADTARSSSRGGSDILDLRIYVRDEGHPMGGKIIALDGAGKPIKDASGGEIALPLSDHEHVGPVAQDLANRVREARAQRSPNAS